MTGRVWASKEELETACSLYEFTWWETSPTVQAMRADAGAHPGLLGRITAARNAGLVRTRDVGVVKSFGPTVFMNFGPST